MDRRIFKDCIIPIIQNCYFHKHRGRRDEGRTQKFGLKGMGKQKKSTKWNQSQGEEEEEIRHALTYIKITMNKISPVSYFTAIFSKSNF